MHHLALVFIIFMAHPVLSADKYSCMEHAEHRQFDFWAGSWRVSDKNNEKHYGNNRITIEERGCLLQERWQSTGGGTGRSINYYDPSDGKWHQLWVDGGASIIKIAGNLTDGSMVLSGEIYYLAQARKADFRGRWTPLPNGSVRQFFEERDADGNWQPWFDGYYHRMDGAKSP